MIYKKYRYNLSNVGCIFIFFMGYAVTIFGYSKSSLGFTDNLAIGSIAGIAEIAVGQPFEYWKIARQQNLPLWVKSSVLYRGSVASAVSYVPSYGAQIALYSLLVDHFKERHNFNSTHQALSAFIAGVGSAGVITPSQVIAIQQQTHNSQLFDTIKTIYNTHGLKSFNRGFAPTAWRWGGFTASYLVLNDIAKQNIKCLYNLDEDISFRQDLACTVSAGIPTGLFATLITHPFDTIKTRMQADFTAKKYKTMHQAAASLYAENKAKAFLTGIAPRTYRVISAIIILNSVKNYLADIRLKQNKEI